MDEEFPLRLYWLSQGEMISGPIPEWVLVWHYRRCPSQELVAAHHASPQRRALAIQRHHPRFRRDLEGLPGLGAAKLERYGDALLTFLAE